jgi:starvation-inducible DNA-binding protein
MHEMIVSDSASQKGSPALAQALAKLLGSVVVFKFTAHGFHWNVKGKDFSQFHKFFGKIYEDVDGSVDPIAESILKLGYDAPYLLSDFLELSCLDRPDRVSSGDYHQMSQILEADNAMLLRELRGVFDIANGCDEQGIANLIAERIEAHQKWQWQLRATLNIQ